LICVASLSLAGCATIFTGDRTNVGVASARPGASVTVDGVPFGRTPVQIPLDKTRAHSIVITTTDGQTYTCLVNSSVGIGWVVLNVFTTFLVGVIVDGLTGKWKSLDQSMCYAPI
jgi:hypothetical protein